MCSGRCDEWLRDPATDPSVFVGWFPNPSVNTGPFYAVPLLLPLVVIRYEFSLTSPWQRGGGSYATFERPASTICALA